MYSSTKGITYCLAFKLVRGLSTKSPTVTPVHHVQRRKHSYDLQLNNGGLENSDFQRRRHCLAKELASLNPIMGIPRGQQKTESDNMAERFQREHFLLIPSAQRTYMVDKIPYVFRQATDFRYLTGSKSHDSALALKFNGDAKEVHSTLILPVSSSEPLTTYLLHSTIASLVDFCNPII